MKARPFFYRHLAPRWRFKNFKNLFTRLSGWCVSEGTACSARSSTAWSGGRSWTAAWTPTVPRKLCRPAPFASESSRQVRITGELLGCSIFFYFFCCRAVSQRFKPLLSHFTALQSSLWCVQGSTDCICFATVGTNDPVTSALHIIVGELSVHRRSKHSQTKRIVWNPWNGKKNIFICFPFPLFLPQLWRL